MSDLGAPFGSESSALGINAQGQILLASTDVLHNHVFVLSQGSFTDTGLTQAAGINDLGQVVGSVPAPGASRVLVYDTSGLHDLGFDGLRYGINNGGQVVGLFPVTNASGQLHNHAFLYTNAVADDLGTLFGGNSAATAINNSGVVVGSSDGFGFIYANGKMTEIDPNGTALALAVNNLGDVVGYDKFGAFVYHNGALSNLNDLIDPSSGLKLTAAYGINDLGQIVGSAMAASGDQHAVPAHADPGAASSRAARRRRPAGAEAPVAVVTDELPRCARSSESRSSTALTCWSGASPRSMCRPGKRGRPGNRGRESLMNEERNDSRPLI